MIYEGGFFQLFSFFKINFYHLKVLETSEKTKSKEATLCANNFWHTRGRKMAQTSSLKTELYL